MTSNAKKRSSGRPPKFDEASRPVTVTLPDRTLNDLDSIGPDRARAIVRVTDMAVNHQQEQSSKPVEVVETAPGQGLIVVAPCAALWRIPWLRIVEVAPFRNLLVLPQGTSVEKFEVAINDLLALLPNMGERDRTILRTLRDLITKIRRNALVSQAELLFVNPTGL